MLREEEISNFHRDGVIGPFKSVGAETASVLRDLVEKIMSNPQSPIYGIPSARDWHLHYRNLLTLVRQPAIIERLKCLLGPDLMIWRSSIFNKAAGDGALGWHQANLFAGEEWGLYKPALQPPPHIETYGDLFNVSVWIALTDITEGNGAVKFALGTHTKQFPVKHVPFGESEFGRLFKDNLLRAGATKRWEELSKRFANETIFDPVAEGSKVISMEMKAGDFMIFTDRVMHCSGPNTTNAPRIGINFRVARPDVAVYPHRLHGDFIDGNEHDISNHACMMLAGSDKAALNVYLN